ncbi:FimV/HubP family polar landmark protein [Duganella sp. P38]|uniref:FimV/HubP family polar landmark protein n=1 Tax=Duganella sp. P38 TaxID=3423949 RepID=UPI003D79619C
MLPPKKIAEPSIFEIIMDNLAYVGLAAVAVLAAALAYVSSRRRKKFVVPQEEASILGEPAAPAPQPPVAEAEGQSVDANNSVFNSNFAPSASQLDTNEVDPVAEADVYIAYGRDAQAEEILKEALRTHPERHAVRLKLLEIYLARKDARAFETQASELYAQTRGQGDEWERAAAMGKTLDPDNPLYSGNHDGGLHDSGVAAPAAAAVVAAGAAAAAPDFGSDYGNTFAAEPESAPALSPLDLDLSQDTAPAASSTDFGANFAAADLETALPQAADASVSPASVAADAGNLMDFDLGGLNFDTASAPPPANDAPASPATAPVDDLSMDFGLDMPAAASAPAVETQPVGTTGPLDLDLAGFDIPEAPAFTAPPQTAVAPLDFDASLDFPPDAATTAPAPAPAAQEFDLSGIDLDLGALAGDTPAAGAQGGEPLSALHMEMDTKLDLAVAYQEIGDKEGARELLDEVLRGGSDEQVAKANAMKAQLG